ncbi:MAG: Sec-independent protein translocase protein TatB [Methyloligellaceae bacterium]
MFDIGWSELLIIAAVAIIVVGPKDLPRMLRSLGKTVGQMKRMAGEFRSQFDDAIRDSELDDIRSSINELHDNNPLTDIVDPLREEIDEVNRMAKEPMTDNTKDKSPKRDQTVEDTDAVAESDPPPELADPEPEIAAEAEPERSIAGGKSGA